MKQLNHYCN